MTGRCIWVAVSLLLCQAAAPAAQGAGCDAPDLAETTMPAPPRTPARFDRSRKLIAHIPKRQVDVVVAGDSLAAGWPRPKIEAAFGGRKVKKIAMSGDRTQDTLWKLQGGDFDPLKPRIVVLIVGTNNLGRNSACAISSGILRVIDDIDRRWHPSTLLVVGIPPRGDGGSFQRQIRLAVNARVRDEVSERANTKFVDVDQRLRCDSATPCSAFRPDLTHLTPQGYDALAAAITHRLRD